MSMPAIEESLRGTDSSSTFEFPYPAEFAAKIRKAINFDAPLHIRLGVPQVAEIPHTVRNIVLDWTMDLEKQGILGTDLTFNEEERAKSVAATAQTVNNINIGQVGSFVQSAENSTVQGGVDAVLNLDRVQRFVDQVEQLLSAADVPQSVKEDTEAALSEVKQVTAAHPHESGKLRAALLRVRQAVEPLGEHLLRIAVDAGIDRLPGILS
jgi:hypothetical protein